MIASLSGKLISKSSNSFIIDVNNVGYFVNISSKTSNIFEIDSHVFLFTKMIVKENDISLYGFHNEDEKLAFELLISVQGVGVKSALNILSLLTPRDLYKSIQSNNLNVFQKINGVGPKLATKIIIDLVHKIPLDKNDILKTDNIALSRIMTNTDGIFDRLKNNLKNLGFNKYEIDSMIMSLNNNSGNLSDGDLLKSVLKTTKKMEDKVHEF